VGNYSITFARSARKEIETLDIGTATKIFHKIEGLSGECRPQGCRKLKGSTNLWRIRIGDYRVIYAIDDKQKNVDIIAVKHRAEAYK
jgi:mRNA interferase RelE/StbE